MYKIMHNQHTQFSKYVHNYVYSIYTLFFIFFKELTQYCKFNVLKFSIDVHNSLYLKYTIFQFVDSVCNFQMVYTILYNKFTHF